MTALRLRRPQPRNRRARVLAATVTIATAVATVAVALARHRRGEEVDGRESWNCECGQGYLVSGTDRHRVYWLSDAPHSDPLLVRECVSCGAELPAGHTAAVI